MKQKQKLSHSGLETLMNPRSVAVIGASREPASVGFGILKSLVEGCVLRSAYCKPFLGRVYAVNPHAEMILGKRCFKRISDVAEDVDVAIISLPAKIVPSVARECGQKGVKALIVVAAGFAETGGEGAKLQAELLAICKKFKMRLLGPNCLGILRPGSNYNASFALSAPPAGQIAFVSQSGALADSILDWALSERYAFSSIVSLGNAADLDAADFLEFFEKDDQTKVITLYLEGLDDGRRFFEVAKRVGGKKPILLLKGGRTGAGEKAATSHTAALAGDWRVFQGAMRQAGVALVDSLEELFDTAKTLATQPRAKGNAITVVTNGGGAGVLASDYCARLGVNLVPLKASTIAKLDATKKMHPAYSRRNPLDIVGDALPQRYEAAMEVLLAEEYVHGLIVIQTLQTMTDAKRDAEAVVRMRAKYPSKPIVCVFMGGHYSAPGIKILRDAGIPDFNDPLKAAKAMAALCGAS
ncbi:CoA-binding protein [Candidatus Micrarchaeota archaeon]|nr:CoA-binding protein [Candidatus Micrarchaeota archaeon]